MGGLLLLGFLAMALLSATRTPVAVASAAAGVAWLTHASLDWLWEVPAVTVPAMACLGLLIGTSAAAEFDPATRVPVAARAAAIGLAAAAALSYALPALAAREIERAARRWDRDPAGALSMLDRARRLNPLTDRADLVAGALALRSGDRTVARDAFRRAAGRDHANWYPRAALGVLDLESGRRAEGLAMLRAAQERDPREPAIAAAIAGIEPVADVTDQLLQKTLPGPLGRKPVTCRPVLGLAARCAREFG